MSVLDHEWTLRLVPPMSALPPGTELLTDGAGSVIPRSPGARDPEPDTPNGHPGRGTRQKVLDLRV